MGFDKLCIWLLGGYIDVCGVKLCFPEDLEKHIRYPQFVVALYLFMVRHLVCHGAKNAFTCDVSETHNTLYYIFLDVCVYMSFV